MDSGWLEVGVEGADYSDKHSICYPPVLVWTKLHGMNGAVAQLVRRRYRPGLTCDQAQFLIPSRNQEMVEVMVANRKNLGSAN
jgi:hypothetical protein